MRKAHVSMGLRWLAAALALGAVMLTCKPVPFTAPADATIQISANPTAIPAVNGVSVITVLGFKAGADGGGPLTDGTQIYLTTNVGVIEERVAMDNGVAYGFLRSNGRAGQAAVTAISGAGISATLETPVRIGNTEGININVTANPASVGPPDYTSDIVATVFDNDNNTLRDIPLIFSTSAGALASQGSILHTNDRGQASDRLTLMNEGSATVTVTSGAITGTVTVNRGTPLDPIVSSISPTSALRGETLNVTINGLNFQPGAVVSFGEGIAINSVTFISSTQLVANITVDENARIQTSGRTVTVTNPDGRSGSLSSAFLIVTPLPTPRISNIAPSSTGTRGSTVTLTISGLDFQLGVVVIFDPGGLIVQDTRFINSTTIEVDIEVPNDAAVVTTGQQFDVTVVNPDGGTDTVTDGFTVTS